jgi:hypothetical protein
MTRYLPAFLLLLSVACAAPAYYGPEEYQQAAPAIRPPPRPPAVTPGYNPNTYEPPPYAPAGGGASHGALSEPNTGKPPVPRSPNKRILPASNEPGLWAADGAPVASGRVTPPLFGVPLPYPPGVGSGEISRRLADSCVASMTEAAEQAGKLARIMRLSEVVRQCMSAHAMKVCADEMWRKLQQSTDDDHQPTDAERTQTEALMMTANALKVDRCRQAAFEEAGESINEQEANDLNKVIDQWIRTNKSGKSSRFTH